MQSAQLLGEHSAYGIVMQGAYARRMSDKLSLRRRRRQQKLLELLSEIGGPTQAALVTGTPRSHFSAMSAGTRGLGDELAAKLEKAYDKPEGWFDQADSAWPFSPELFATVSSLNTDGLVKLEGVMRAHLGMAQLVTEPIPERTAQPYRDQPVTATVPAPAGQKPSRVSLNQIRLGAQSGGEVGEHGQVQKPGRGRRA